MFDGDDIRRWLTSRAGVWRQLVKNIDSLSSGNGATVEEALGAVEAYRGLARDLATARRVAPNTRTTAGLESLYGHVHALINRTPRGGMAGFVDLLRVDVPRAARQVRMGIIGMAMLMTVSALAGWWLIMTFPALVSVFASEEMIEHVEQGHLWTEGIFNIMPSSILSVSILANNIVVSVLAFCAGIFLGLGTLYLIAMNGFMLGAAFAFVHQHGLAHALFEFIIAHGPVELSVICIAGATGVALGDSIIRPTTATRRDSFEACAHLFAPLLLLCALFLVGSGFIEGFISPDSHFPMPSRVTIGLGYWLIMWALMSGRLFAKDSPDQARRRWRKFA
jgi:uncharacterized membrane protein SpoIIM required for sporulation